MTGKKKDAFEMSLFDTMDSEIVLDDTTVSKFVVQVPSPSQQWLNAKIDERITTESSNGVSLTESGVRKLLAVGYGNTDVALPAQAEALLKGVREGLKNTPEGVIPIKVKKKTIVDKMDRSKKQTLFRFYREGVPEETTVTPPVAEAEPEATPEADSSE